MKTTSTHSLSRKMGSDLAAGNSLSRLRERARVRASVIALALLALCPLHLAQSAAAALSMTNGPASNITRVAATVYGNLTGTNAATNVMSLTLYYGISDATTNAATWGNSNFYGTVTNLGTVSNVISSLTPSQFYYYRWYAAQSTSNVWAHTTSNFWTLAGAPTSGVTNATYVPVMADTNGNLVAPTNFWGANTGNMASAGMATRGEMLNTNLIAATAIAAHQVTLGILSNAIPWGVTTVTNVATNLFGTSVGLYGTGLYYRVADYTGKPAWSNYDGAATWFLWGSGTSWVITSELGVWPEHPEARYQRVLANTNFIGDYENLHPGGSTITISDASTSTISASLSVYSTSAGNANNLGGMAAGYYLAQNLTNTNNIASHQLQIASNLVAITNEAAIRAAADLAHDAVLNSLQLTNAAKIRLYTAGGDVVGVYTNLNAAAGAMFNRGVAKLLIGPGNYECSTIAVSNNALAEVAGAGAGITRLIFAPGRAWIWDAVATGRISNLTMVMTPNDATGGVTATDAGTLRYEYDNVVIGNTETNYPAQTANYGATINLYLFNAHMFGRRTALSGTVNTYLYGGTTNDWVVLP